MRIRIGAAMPLKGGRPCVIAVEVRESIGDRGRVLHYFEVGHVERVTPHGIETTAARVVDAMGRLADRRPCVVVDTGSAQGLALYQLLRETVPSTLHKPHAFPGTGHRSALFAAFLDAYAGGRVTFRRGLGSRSDLDRALVFFGGRGQAHDGVDLSSEDEAMVMALGLAMQYPRHGAAARTADPDTRLKAKIREATVTKGGSA